MTARLVRAALAGTLATAAMSAVLVAGEAAGFLGEPPPKHITARAAHKVGLPLRTSPDAFQLAWIVAHFGYGTAFGLVYTVLWRRFISSAPASLLYGIGLWAISYFAVMPKMGLFPPPQHDSLRREGVMIAAHMVYGLSLEEIDRALVDGRRD